MQTISEEYQLREEEEKTVSNGNAQLDEIVINISPIEQKYALSWEEAERLQRIHGKNVIQLQKPLSWWKILLNSFIHPFNILLLVLAAISGGTQDFRTMGIMLLMIALSVLLRFVQELKSEVAAQALKNLVRNKATVIRKYRSPDDRDPTWEDVAKIDAGATEEFEIPMEDIVSGDLVKLAAGDMIPGDVQLLQSKDLFISQSALTGEAMPIEKRALSETEESAGKLDSPDMCFMGSNVISGSAKGIVVKIGSNTLFGELAKELVKNRPVNAFQKGIKKISILFLIVMAVMVPAVFLISGLVNGVWLQSFLFAVAVAVGLTPEMLPMIVNASLARGALVMAKKKCIVKRLDSIINMGGMDVLCTDKTGTLTQDKVVLMQHVDPRGKPAILPLEMSFLNAYFQTGLKNLLDRAIIEYFEKDDPDKNITRRYTKIDEIPFDFVRRRMSVVLECANTKEVLLISKGAVEETLAICSHIVYPEGEKEITSELLLQIQQCCEALNQEGLRVVGVAFKNLEPSEQQEEFSIKHEKGLHFVGFLAFLDPPKETAGPAIKELISKGITIKVLTGDTPLVCLKVCSQLGLPVKAVITTNDLKGISDDELEEIAEQGTIFAKLTPIEKAKVVHVLKRKHVVGFMGDGINDAAALKEADVGISVDSAVDVAKESADFILLEKSLLVLVKGVVQGRITYGNTIKYIKMAISSNFGNVFSVLVASAWLPFLPMLPIQLLIQNLLYDFSQIAIPWDHMDAHFLQQPIKWNPYDILKFMICLGPLSSIFDITTFLFMWYYYDCQTPAKQHLFQTAWFVEGLLTQTSIIHMIRTDKIPFIQSRASLPVLIGTGMAMAAGVAIPYTPLAPVISMVPLPSMYYAYLVGALTGYVIISQIGKLIFVKVFKKWM